MADWPAVQLWQGEAGLQRLAELAGVQQVQVGARCPAPAASQRLLLRVQAGARRAR